jgi:predicted lipoprotein with Yx(FWY)xxD motif
VRNFAVALVASAGLLTGVLAGCGSDEGTTAEPAQQPPAATSAATATPPATSPSASAIRGTVVKTASSDFGQMLFDDTGQAIYLFDKETTAKPDCYGDCAKAWPPVLTEGEPVAAGGAQADQLGTTKRTDGAVQVTYGGHPLYYYAHEGKNQVLCHNVREYGGLWLVVTPEGDAAPV